MKTNLPSLSAPIYRDKLPSTDEEFTYRPFLVREEKLLQLIKDDGDIQQMYDSLKQLIQNCTGLNAEKLSVFDIEYIFLRLREKSVGEIIELKMKHIDSDTDCSHVEQVSMDLSKIKIIRNDEHHTIITLDPDRNIRLQMRYPKYKDILKLQKSQEFNSILEVLINCTEIILEGEEVYETKDFNQKELTDFFLQLGLSHMDSVKKFFDTMPKVCYELEWTCSKCEKHETHLIEGVQNFLS